MSESLEFRIVKASDDRFEIKPELAAMAASRGNMELKVKFDFNPSVRMLNCRSEVHVNVDEGDESREAIMAVASMMFELSEESVQRLTVQDDVVIPVAFLHQCASLTVGILRGAVVSRMNALGLAAFVLPPLKISGCIDKPLITPLR